MNRKLSLPALLIACAVAAGCGIDPLNDGIRALERGDAARAEHLLDQATQIQPADASAWANLGIARQKQGKTDEALKAFRQAADLDHDDARPLEFIAAVHSDRNQWKPALDALNEAVRREPKSPRLLTALAVAEWHIYGPQTARSRLTDVLAIAPNYSPALFNMAIVQRDGLHQPAEAAAMFQRYLKLAPNDPHAAEARAALGAAATPLSGAPRPAVQTPPRTTPPAAATPPRPAVAVPPKPVSVPPAPAPAAHNPQAAADAYNRANRSLAAGDYDHAIQDYGRAIQNSPGMADAHYNLGLAYTGKGDAASARAAFQQALELAPDMANARYAVALGYRDQGDTARAVSELSTVIKQQPQHADAHLALGLIYRKDPAKLSLARQELTRYLELAPNGASARDVRNWLKFQR